MANPGPEALWLILRDTETRLKAFDTLIERYVGVDTGGLTIQRSEVPRTLLTDWRELRAGLFLTLGAAYGGALKGDRPSNDVETLARAMKKVLPPQLLAEVIAHLDPLTPFVEFLQRKDLEPR